MKSKLIPTPTAPIVEQPLTFPCLIEQRNLETGKVELLWLASKEKSGTLLFGDMCLATPGHYVCDGSLWSDWIKAPIPGGAIKRRVIPASEAVTITFQG